MLESLEATLSIPSCAPNLQTQGNKAFPDKPTSGGPRQPALVICLQYVTPSYSLVIPGPRAGVSQTFFFFCLTGIWFDILSGIGKFSVIINVSASIRGNSGSVGGAFLGVELFKAGNQPLLPLSLFHLQLYSRSSPG